MVASLPPIKLTKDQWQKIILSVIMLAILIYCYFEFLLNPLQASAVAAEAQSVKIEADIKGADARLREFGALKTRAAEAGDLVTQVNAFIPDGAPIAWFPPRIKAFFARQGMRECVVRPLGTDRTGDAELDKTFSNVAWGVDLPTTEFVPLGIALAGLENEEPNLEITSLRISTRAENPEQQQVTLDVLTLLKR